MLIVFFIITWNVVNIELTHNDSALNFPFVCAWGYKTSHFEIQGFHLTRQSYIFLNWYFGLIELCFKWDLFGRALKLCKQYYTLAMIFELLIILIIYETLMRHHMTSVDDLENKLSVCTITFWLIIILDINWGNSLKHFVRK